MRSAVVMPPTRAQTHCHLLRTAAPLPPPRSSAVPASAGSPPAPPRLRRQASPGRPRPWEREFPTRARENAPGPAKAKASAAAMFVIGSSAPPSDTHTGFPACTSRVATAMAPRVESGPTGCARPSAVNAPPPNSDNPAIMAHCLPGRKPIDSSQPPVPSRPYPPNQPNSFCAPYWLLLGCLLGHPNLLPRSTCAGHARMDAGHGPGDRLTRSSGEECVFTLMA
jgi:hypothetical protein